MASNWWVFQITMTVYVVSMPLLAATWVGYAYVLIHNDDPLGETLKKMTVIMLPYAAYSLLALTNPFTGLFFTLSKSIEYKRGVLFMPVGVGFIMLYSFIGLTHLAKSEDDIQTVKGYLHKIDSSSKFLLGLINDILDMSKIENGEMTLNEAPFSYGEFILIFNQPTDKSSAEISPFFVKLPCRAASPPAVTFLDWAYFICRLCL